MLIDLYVFRESPVHRAPPGAKLVALIVFSTAVFALGGWPTLAIATAVLMAAYGLAGIGAGAAWRSLKPAFWVLVIIFIAQIALGGLDEASFVVVRFSILILAASLLTMTTKTSEFVEGIRSGLSYAPSWFPSDQTALAISLALRFIPLVRMILEEVRMAQRARGLDWDVKAMIVPLIVRTLKTGDEIAEAIQARTPL